MQARCSARLCDVMACHEMPRAPPNSPRSAELQETKARKRAEPKTWLAELPSRDLGPPLILLGVLLMKPL